MWHAGRARRCQRMSYRLFVRILNHTHGVGHIFATHLQGQPHADAATNTPDTPALDGWLCDYARSLSAA